MELWLPLLADAQFKSRDIIKNPNFTHSELSSIILPIIRANFEQALILIESRDGRGECSKGKLVGLFRRTTLSPNENHPPSVLRWSTLRHTLCKLEEFINIRLGRTYAVELKLCGCATV